MKIIKKILKWIGLSIGTLLALIVLAGLGLRLFGPASYQPEGELIDVGGFKLHINISGEKSDKPTLVIEGGGGMSTEFYHWLNEGLKDSIRVVRYDRAGIGFSDECTTPRDPEIIAHELHTLLENAGESPPYILAGHSLGGPYIRVFAELFPDEVAGLIFMDPTHPQQVELLGAPSQNSGKFKLYMAILKAQGVLGEMGIITLYDQLFGPFYFGEGLPEELNTRVRSFLNDGKLIRGHKEEMVWYHAGLERSGKTGGFGSMPIRVFTATGLNAEELRAKGLNPDEEVGEKKSIKAHQDYANLSTQGEQILVHANHVTIFSKKENADIICQEVMEIVREGSPNNAND